MGVPNAQKSDDTIKLCKTAHIPMCSLSNCIAEEVKAYVPNLSNVEYRVRMHTDDADS